MTKARILLVQSAQTQGNSTRWHLEGLGYDVIFAGSGLTALAAVKKAAVDVILLDVALPDVEGLELCRRFRGLDVSRSTPIILLVGRGFSPESFGNRTYRPDLCVEKPCTEHELKSRIFSLLKSKADGASEQRPSSLPACGLSHGREQKPVLAAAPAPEPKSAQRPILRLVPKTAAASPPSKPDQESGAGAVIDAATGLFSRQQFEAMFSKSFKQCQRFKQHMSCMFIDLDGSKMGRKADQSLIKAIVGLVQTTIREVDTAAWWTGESLIVLLPNTIRNDAVQAAARVLEAVATHSFTGPDSTQVAMSIGVSGLPDSAIDSEQKLIDAAEKASRSALDMMAPVPKALEEFVRNRTEPTNTKTARENVT